MKFGVIGRSEWLFETVLELISEGHLCQFIVTSKEAPEYTKTAQDFEELAKSLSVPFLRTTNLDSAEATNFFDCNSSDLVVSINFASIIGKSVISRFPLGILNAHGGDLPRYRGNACQAWAIINGEDQIAICIHRMIEGEVDAGDILAREFMAIDETTKIADVFNWFSKVIPKLYIGALRELEQDPGFILETQVKNPALSLRCYPRCPSDGEIDWSRKSIDIIRLINASGPPYAGAFSFLDSEKVTILNAELYEDGIPVCAVVGQILKIDRAKNVVVVATGDGKLKVSTLTFKEKIYSMRQRFESRRMQ